MSRWENPFAQPNGQTIVSANVLAIPEAVSIDGGEAIEIRDLTGWWADHRADGE